MVFISGRQSSDGFTEDGPGHSTSQRWKERKATWCDEDRQTSEPRLGHNYNKHTTNSLLFVGPCNLNWQSTVYDMVLKLFTNKQLVLMKLWGFSVSNLPGCRLEISNRWVLQPPNSTQVFRRSRKIAKNDY